MNILKSSERSVALFIAREIEVPLDDESDESDSSITLTPRNNVDHGSLTTFLLLLIIVNLLLHFISRLVFLLHT